MSAVLLPDGSTLRANRGKFTFTLDSPDEYYAVLFNDEGYTEMK